VRLVGAVPELVTVFDQVRLTAAPLRFGAGIKLAQTELPSALPL
jgi:hypothetical protein